MNRRQLLSTFAAAPVAALAGTERESFSSLPLTTHDHKVLSLLYNNLYEWLSWENGDQPNKMSNEVRHNITRQTMNIFREQYQRSILRHVAGVQPLRHPTGFLYVESETVPALRSPLFCHTTRSQMINPFFLYEMLDKSVIQWLTQSGTDFKEIPGITENELERHSKTNGFFIISHPKNEYVARLFSPNRTFVTEHAPTDRIIAGRKTSEYNAPLFYGPYIPLIGNGQNIHSFKFDEKNNSLSLIDTGIPLMKTRLFAFRMNPMHNNSWVFKV